MDVFDEKTKQKVIGVSLVIAIVVFIVALFGGF